MNNDYLEIRNAEGMPKLVDATIALDFLLVVKSGIRNYAMALAETASPEARAALCSLLNDEIDMHAELSQLMMDKGWLYPFNVNEQFKLDGKSADTAVKIADMKLFPDNTNRLGTFATPDK